MASCFTSKSEFVCKWQRKCNLKHANYGKPQANSEKKDHITTL